MINKRILVWMIMLLFGLVLLLIVTTIPLGRSNHSEDTVSQEITAESTGEQLPTLPELPTGWSYRQMTKENLSQGTLVLVNKNYSYDPTLPQTISVYEHKTKQYLVRDTILSVRQEIMEALNQWMNDFAAEKGKTDINIVAGWRSYDDQLRLYQNAIDKKGQAHADAYLALPGHSEHHTGLAVDLDTYDVATGISGGFEGEGDYAWVVDHAWEYGFIQRYPPNKRDITGIAYESWHFRYVGLPHSRIMAEYRLCLEEYIDYLRNYPYFGEHLYVTLFEQEYEIYYCPKEQVVVPTTHEYHISGNNVDGFIITIPKNKEPKI